MKWYLVVVALALGCQSRLSEEHAELVAKLRNLETQNETLRHLGLQEGRRMVPVLRVCVSELTGLAVGSCAQLLQDATGEEANPLLVKALKRHVDSPSDTYSRVYLYLLLGNPSGTEAVPILRRARAASWASDTERAFIAWALNRITGENNSPERKPDPLEHMTN